MMAQPRLPSARIDRPPMGDHAEERSNRTAMEINAIGVLPQVTEDVLGDVLRDCIVARHTAGQAVDQGRVEVVQLGQRRLVASDQTITQPWIGCPRRNGAFATLPTFAAFAECEIVLHHPSHRTALVKPLTCADLNGHASLSIGRWRWITGREETPRRGARRHCEIARHAGCTRRGTGRFGDQVSVSPVGLAKARSRPVKRSTTSAASNTR